MEGYYCEIVVLINVIGLCNVGYFCLKGVEVLILFDDSRNLKWFGECLEGGYYCEKGVF